MILQEIMVAGKGRFESSIREGTGDGIMMTFEVFKKI